MRSRGFEFHSRSPPAVHSAVRRPDARPWARTQTATVTSASSIKRRKTWHGSRRNMVESESEFAQETNETGRAAQYVCLFAGGSDRLQGKRRDLWGSWACLRVDCCREGAHSLYHVVVGQPGDNLLKIPRSPSVRLRRPLTSPRPPVSDHRGSCVPTHSDGTGYIQVRGPNIL